LRELRAQDGDVLKGHILHIVLGIGTLEKEEGEKGTFYFSLHEGEK